MMIKPDKPSKRKPVKKKPVDLRDSMYIGLKERVQHMKRRLEEDDIASPIEYAINQLQYKVEILTFIIKINQLSPFHAYDIESWKYDLNSLTADLEAEDLYDFKDTDGEVN